MRREVRAAAFVLALALLVAPGRAAARTTSSLPYASDSIWAAAVRYLRVDRGFPVREKDQDAGYVLFDFPEAGKTYHAALELVALTDEDGRITTSVAISIAGLPKRYEAGLLEGLTAKIREERGAATPAPARRPTKPSPPDGEGARERARDAGNTPPPQPNKPASDGLPRIPTLPSP